MNFPDLISQSAHLKLIVVGGVARSGTQMISDLLNQHPMIAIEAEMHAKTIEAYFDLLDLIQSNFVSYSKRKNAFAKSKGLPADTRLDTHWQDSQHALHHMFLATATKPPRQKPVPKAVQYHGIKTPGYERYFDKFETMFPQAPLYIYALRSVGPVWRSWVTRGFLSQADVELFRTRYIRSLRQARRIKRRAGDRFVVFDLDAYVRAADQRAYVEDKVLAPLQIPGFPAWPTEGVENANSATALGLSLSDDDRLHEQIERLEADTDIAALKHELLTQPKPAI